MTEILHCCSPPPQHVVQLQLSVSTKSSCWVSLYHICVGLQGLFYKWWWEHHDEWAKMCTVLLQFIPRWLWCMRHTLKLDSSRFNYEMVALIWSSICTPLPVYSGRRAFEIGLSQCSCKILQQWSFDWLDVSQVCTLQLPGSIQCTSIHRHPRLSSNFTTTFWQLRPRVLHHRHC